MLFFFPNSFVASNSVNTNGANGISKASATISHEYRFFFYRRLFRGSREMSEEPSEIALLYGQACYSVVDLDQYPVNDKVALQLAGLQLQASIGDPGLGNTFFHPFKYILLANVIVF